MVKKYTVYMPMEIRAGLSYAAGIKRGIVRLFIMIIYFRAIGDRVQPHLGDLVLVLLAWTRIDNSMLKCIARSINYPSDIREKSSR